MTEREFEELVRRYKTTIYMVCYMFADDADDAEDLFQEVLITVWNGIGSVKERSKIESWIYRLSLNTCISATRKRRRRQDVRLSMNVDLYDVSDSDTRQIKMLYDRIHRLKPFDRAIVLLWLENLSYDEIGDIVGITAKNVSVRLVRIRQELMNMSNQ